MNTIRRTITPVGILAFSALLLSSAQQPLLAQDRPPIIDMHLHADRPPHDVPAAAPALSALSPAVARAVSPLVSRWSVPHDST
jgi:hypothetical protein